MDLIADTTFMVGLWRSDTWARTFAREHASKSIGIPWVALGEFWHGAIRAGHDQREVGDFLSLWQPITDVQPVILAYAKLCTEFQSNPAYRQVGQNDLWIAATAIACQRPLVTRNRRHFDAMPGLDLVAPTA